ncbi:MAG: phosphoserine transaminase [Candidatus Sumerlaeota bacterium]|nr:phosphoserine transaminase [Candidatus Sumerlaeota bacterium]
MPAAKPSRKPAVPSFSSGPCPKRPGWNPSILKDAVLGRSHRGKLGKARLARAIDETRELLGVPKDFLIGIMPASDTGAVECALWSLLGPRPVTVLVWESFSEGWATDVVKQLKIKANVVKAPYGEVPDLSKVDWTNDVVYVWNGTTSGVKVPNGDWIAADRQGLSICDGTSAAFAMEIPWDKVDVFTYSWQKVLGGEGAHGVLILSPHAIERINTYDPAWPMPKIFRLKSKGKINEGIFKGETINTPSMMCVEDYLDAMAWARGIGGRPQLIARTEGNLAIVEKWVAANPRFGFLAKEKAIRSCTSVCVSVLDAKFMALSEDDRKAKIKDICSLLEKEGAACDIASYRDAPAGFRFWCGPTVESSDLECALEWVVWAYEQTMA